MVKLLDDFSRLSKIKAEQGLRIKITSSPSLYIAQRQLAKKLIEWGFEYNINELTKKYRINFTYIKKLSDKVTKINDLQKLESIEQLLFTEDGYLKALEIVKKHKR